MWEVDFSSSAVSIGIFKWVIMILWRYCFKEINTSSSAVVLIVIHCSYWWLRRTVSSGVYSGSASCYAPGALLS